MMRAPPPPPQAGRARRGARAWASVPTRGRKTADLYEPRSAITMLRAHPPPPRTRSRVRTIRQLFDLSGSVALVTGGGRGLGEQIARGLAQAGAAVALGSRKKEACDEVAAAPRDGDGGRRR